MREDDESRIIERIRRISGSLAGSAPVSVERMTGGASSLTYSARMSCPSGASRSQQAKLVVKVAPPGLPPTLNRDVLRQARVMRALAPSGVPVPVVLHEDPGHPPGEPPLVVMTFVPGECLEPLTHPNGADVPAPDVVRSRALHAARIMASLHGFPWEWARLGPEPAMSLRQEVERWVRAFSTVPADLAAGASEAGKRLLESVPAPLSPVLVHGDFRLGNMLCEAGEVCAVVDWETWGIGDPRIDVGWLLMSCDGPSQPHAARSDAGMPSRDDLLSAYTADGGSMPARIDWFIALSQFRAGAMTALILKHDRRRAARDTFVSWWDPEIPQRFIAMARDGVS